MISSTEIQVLAITFQAWPSLSLAQYPRVRSYGLTVGSALTVTAPTSNLIHNRAYGLTGYQSDRRFPGMTVSAPTITAPTVLLATSLIGAYGYRACWHRAYAKCYQPPRLRSYWFPVCLALTSFTFAFRA